MASRGFFVDAHGCRWDSNNAEYEGMFFISDPTQQHNINTFTLRLPFIYTGWLQKKSKWLKQWRKRYFILKGTKIFFSKSATAAPHGMINMVDCLKVEDTGAFGSSKKYSMKIVLRDVVYNICADSEEMMNHWIRLIKKAVSEHSSCEEVRASITSDSITPFSNPFTSVRA